MVSPVRVATCQLVEFSGSAEERNPSLTGVRVQFARHDQPKEVMQRVSNRSWADPVRPVRPVGLVRPFRDTSQVANFVYNRDHAGRDQTDRLSNPDRPDRPDRTAPTAPGNDKRPGRPPQRRPTRASYDGLLELEAVGHHDLVPDSDEVAYEQRVTVAAGVGLGN